VVGEYPQGKDVILATANGGNTWIVQNAGSIEGGPCASSARATSQR
jgi:hypothetical protein